jgi:hypothetical protein
MRELMTCYSYNTVILKIKSGFPGHAFRGIVIVADYVLEGRSIYLR